MIGLIGKSSWMRSFRLRSVSAKNEVMYFFSQRCMSVLIRRFDWVLFS